MINKLFSNFAKLLLIVHLIGASSAYANWVFKGSDFNGPYGECYSQDTGQFLGVGSPQECAEVNAIEQNNIVSRKEIFLEEIRQQEERARRARAIQENPAGAVTTLPKNAYSDVTSLQGWRCNKEYDQVGKSCKKRR